MTSKLECKGWLQEAALRGIDAWAAQARLSAHGAAAHAARANDASRPAGPALPPGAPPVAAAPDDRDDLIRGLHDRIAALEQRLAEPEPTP